VLVVITISLSGAETLNPESEYDERERVPEAADAGPALTLQPDHCLRCHLRPGAPPRMPALIAIKTDQQTGSRTIFNSARALISLGATPMINLAANLLSRKSWYTAWRLHSNRIILEPGASTLNPHLLFCGHTSVQVDCRQGCAAGVDSAGATPVLPAQLTRHACRCPTRHACRCPTLERGAEKLATHVHKW